ncbi:hypothetical protein B0H14DRAFT_3613991 [Mycena olivaceomarginata]|nr:hypothetical protein B0H14DRAFT_3613991 [Mycena olivaceomarginata]
MHASECLWELHQTFDNQLVSLYKPEKARKRRKKAASRQGDKSMSGNHKLEIWAKNNLRLNVDLALRKRENLQLARCGSRTHGAQRAIPPIEGLSFVQREEMLEPSADTDYEMPYAYGEDAYGGADDDGCGNANQNEPLPRRHRTVKAQQDNKQFQITWNCWTFLPNFWEARCELTINQRKGTYRAWWNNRSYSDCGNSDETENETGGNINLLTALEVKNGASAKKAILKAVSDQGIQLLFAAVVVARKRRKRAGTHCSVIWGELRR